MVKFRYYIVTSGGDAVLITGTNDSKIANAVGQDAGTQVIDTDIVMEISGGNPVDIAEEDGYVL